MLYEDETGRRALFLFGGCGVGVHGDLSRYDVQTRTWSRIQLTTESHSIGLVPPRCYHASAVVGEHGYIFGGAGERHGQLLGDTWQVHLGECGRLPVFCSQAKL